MIEKKEIFLFFFFFFSSLLLEKRMKCDRNVYSMSLSCFNIHLTLLYLHHHYHHTLTFPNCWPILRSFFFSKNFPFQFFQTFIDISLQFSPFSMESWKFQFQSKKKTKLHHFPCSTSTRIINSLKVNRLILHHSGKHW